MILKKIGTEYKLYEKDDSCIATTHKSPHKRLSKQNCDEIFGVTDVEKLAENNGKGLPFIDYEEDLIIYKIGVNVGFNKAMELNKDKLFTVEDVKRAIFNFANYDYKNMSELDGRDKAIQSIQQPTEIEVEIEMENYVKYVPKSLGTVYPTGGVRPRLDENDCLILKKK